MCIDIEDFWSGDSITWCMYNIFPVQVGTKLLDYSVFLLVALSRSLICLYNWEEILFVPIAGKANGLWVWNGYDKLMKACDFPGTCRKHVVRYLWIFLAKLFMEAMHLIFRFLQDISHYPVCTCLIIHTMNDHAQCLATFCWSAIHNQSLDATDVIFHTRLKQSCKYLMQLTWDGELYQCNENHLHFYSDSTFWHFHSLLCSLYYLIMPSDITYYGIFNLLLRHPC